MKQEVISIMGGTQNQELNLEPMGTAGDGLSGGVCIASAKVCRASVVLNFFSNVSPPNHQM